MGSKPARVRGALAWVAAASVAAGCASVVEPTIELGWSADQAAQPLRHADCVELALGSTQNVAAWRARQLAAEAALRQARAGGNPRFSATWENFALARTASSAGLEQTFSLSAALEDWFARAYRVAAAEANVAAESAELATEQRALHARVWQAYDALAAARSRVVLEQQLLATAARQEAAVQRLVAVGLNAPVDVERATAERLETESNLAAAQFEALLQEIAFAFLLGFREAVPLVLAEPMSALSDARIDAARCQIDAAVAARPEVAAARSRYEAALANAHLSAARLSLLPTLSGGYRRSGQDLGVASVELPLPILDPGSAAQDEGEAALLAAAAHWDDSVRRVHAELSDVIARARGAEDMLQLHARPLAERRQRLLEASERLFEAGEVTYDAVLLAQRDEIAARVALLEAQAQAATASTDLDHAFGR
ncbi:MAG: TolC family protein [Planctomycetota bacterium]